MAEKKWHRDNVDEKRLKAFGKHLAEIRKSKGMTQEDLAFKSELSFTQIARIETGVINTTLNTIFIICDALEISPAALFEEFE